MKVSVIITTYQHSFSDLNRAVDSVLDQITDHKFEVIVINDNMMPFINFDYRIQIINTGHIGMMRAYQMGFNAAKRQIYCVL